MPPHLTSLARPDADGSGRTLRQDLVRSVAAECGGPRAVAFDPAARAYEAFSLGRTNADGTALRQPLAATCLTDALAEVTNRWAWDRGDRLGVREIGPENDKLMVYAVRRKSEGTHVYRNFQSVIEHARWLEHVATIDLNVIAGIPVGLVGSERSIHEHDQAKRPEGARLTR